MGETSAGASRSDRSRKAATSRSLPMDRDGKEMQCGESEVAVAGMGESSPLGSPPPEAPDFEDVADAL